MDRSSGTSDTSRVSHLAMHDVSEERMGEDTRTKIVKLATVCLICLSLVAIIAVAIDWLA